MSEYPAVYLPFARRKYPGPSPQVVNSHTDVVIDGYTRCGTTFAVYAFQLAQERPVSVAHHLHAPAQLIAAARRHIPALVLIRDPEGAVLSQLVLEPYVDVRDALWAYARFYTRLSPYRSEFAVGDYREVTKDFAPVIRRFNQRFATSYAEFVATDANTQACLDLIKLRPSLSPTLLGFESGAVSLAELRHEQQHHPHLFRPRGSSELWIPSADRDRQKDLLRNRWRQPDLAARRRKAELIYRRFLNGS
jgi:hypothetical protein